MTIYARADAWLTTTARGELLMMHTQSGAFQGLNETGAFLWAELAEPRGREALVEALLAEFDVTEDRARADIDAFLAGMTERGLLRTLTGA